MDEHNKISHRLASVFIRVKRAIGVLIVLCHFNAPAIVLTLHPLCSPMKCIYEQTDHSRDNLLNNRLKGVNQRSKNLT